MSDNNIYPERYSLKYQNDVPENYNISKLQFTFDFIYLILKRDASINEAVENVSKEYALSEEYLMNYLIENRYILNKVDMNSLSMQLKKYNTKSLKRILKKHGIKTSGKRERIEKRILDNKLLGNNYYLSSKSKIFYKNKKRRIKIFNEYLSQYYYFDEYNEFYMDNFRKKEANIPIEFINLHIDKSIEDKNHERFISSNEIMARHFLEKENYKKMLGYVLKNYCMDLNPIWKIDELKQHSGIKKSTYDYLLLLQKKLSKNIVINAYYPIWDSFDFDRIIVSKYDGYKYLKDILNFKDYNKINEALQNRFYLNDDLNIKRITQKTLFDF
ncbi:SAP domain-containing protein [uncultured Methanobrevibacter sp.]|uniref:SAP domain-containing protein n=1 Tax=uncultured Methanobrevibacter sp. TaxID=253161 RepID=UPI0025EA579C|nr:SAP domain-containing protein [uncultured Methanobrevibacter sp.]